MPYRMLLFARMVDRETARSLHKRFGLTLAEWRLLAIACSLGPCTASEIGTAGEIDRAEISRAMRKLARSGLLERSPDPTHGKRQIISSTPSGQALFEEVRDERRSFFRTIMADLTGAERKEVERSLQKMAERLSALDRE